MSVLLYYLFVYCVHIDRGSRGISANTVIIFTNKCKSITARDLVKSELTFKWCVAYNDQMNIEEVIYNYERTTAGRDP